MKHFQLVRHKEVADYATYGTLFQLLDGPAVTPVCVTLERPWVDKDQDGHRDHGVSRFVPGAFPVIMAPSPHFKGRVLPHLCNVPDVAPAGIVVPGRPDLTVTTALMHNANWPWQLEGCVALGTALGSIEYDGDTVTAAVDPRYPRVHRQMYAGISASMDALAKFLKLLDGDQLFLLTVVDAFGSPMGAWVPAV